MTPRVLHVITDTDRRGAQTAAMALHEELLLRDWPSDIVALTQGQHGGLAVPALGTSAVSRSTLSHLRGAARTADVVVAHGSTTLPACAVALAKQAPFVYVNIGDPRAWLTTRTRRVRTRAFLRSAAAVAAISPRSAETLTTWVGVPPRKVRVLPNMRDAMRFHPRPEAERHAIREGLGLPTGPLVVWMGSLTEEKRPDLALRVAEGSPRATLVMAGAGPLGETLGPAARASGVQMLGTIADTAPLIAAADVLLATSDTEGVPGVLIEAGLSGVPAASTDVGFVADVVLDGRTGRLARSGDVTALVSAVSECLDNRAPWGAAAREHCQRTFSTDVVVHEWEDLLHAVAGGQR